LRLLGEGLAGVLAEEIPLPINLDFYLVGVISFCHLVGSFSACFVPVERMVSAYMAIVNSNIELREPIPAKALLIS
jgi:hypothetical protein